MPSQFLCPKCQTAITIRFLNPGEKCICRSCGAEVIVPDDCETVAVAVKPVRKSSIDVKPSPSDTEIRKAGHGLRMVHYTAVIANGMQILMYLIGLSMMSITGAGQIFVGIYLLTPILSIGALFSQYRGFINTMIGTNIVIILLQVFVIATNASQQARMGAFMIIVVGGITAIALSIDKGESWLSLFLERKRMEEKKKIDALREGTVGNQKE